MRVMANIACVLKTEITLVARKQVRAGTTALKKAASTCRTEIVALKRRAETLEAELRRLGKGQANAKAVETAEESGHRLRFTAKGFASQRPRLDPSAAECGVLVGKSGQSVYKWEDGKASGAGPSRSYTRHS